MASSPSPEASENERDDGTDSNDADEGDDAGLPNNDEMSTWCTYPFVSRHKRVE